MMDAVISSSSEASSSVDITALASSSIVSANPLCGNGRLEGAEECEQGIRACPTGFTCDRFLCRCAALPASSARPAAASSAARSSFICGDRILDPGEDCESGIPCSAGASCNSTCKCILRSSSSVSYEENNSFSSSSLYEPYTSSPSFPFFPSYESSFSSIGPSCGNGVLEEGEQCERNNSCGEGGVCNLDCRCDIPASLPQPGSSAAANLCGNGRVEDGEDCDDENISFMDGCLPSCEVEPGYACAGEPSNCFPVCGDGILIAPEECDDGNLSDGDGCSALCTGESSLPSAPTLPDEWIPPASSLPASPEVVIAQPQLASQASLSSSSVGVVMPQEMPAAPTVTESQPSFFRRIYLFFVHLFTE
jgi:cysteine-rich repeat protein